MSDLEKVPSASDLTAYNVDGLELFFTHNRKVRASQSAIARMCSTEDKVVAQGQIRQYITTFNPLKNDVVSAEAMTKQGLRTHLLYNSETIVLCLQKYNASRLMDFMAFGIDEGLAQMAGVPLPVAIVSPVPMSPEEQMVIMAENSLKWAKLQLAAKNNPGDVRQMAATLDNPSNTLDGMGTIFDMAEANDIVLSPDQARSVGMVMAGIVKGRKEVKIMPKTRRRTKDASGNSQSYLVNTYPLSMTASFLSAYYATCA